MKIFPSKAPDDEDTDQQPTDEDAANDKWDSVADGFTDDGVSGDFTALNIAEVSGEKGKVFYRQAQK